MSAPDAFEGSPELDQAGEPMRVADLIDGLVGLDREPFEWEQYKKVLREKMAAAGAAKLSDLMRIEFERSATV